MSYQQTRSCERALEFCWQANYSGCSLFKCCSPSQISSRLLLLCMLCMFKRAFLESSVRLLTNLPLSLPCKLAQRLPRCDASCLWQAGSGCGENEEVLEQMRPQVSREIKTAGPFSPWGSVTTHNSGRLGSMVSYRGVSTEGPLSGPFSSLDEASLWA